MPKSSSDVKVTFTGDTSDLDKKLAKLEKEVGETSKEIDTITTSSGKSAKGLKTVSDRANDAGDRFFALSDVLNGTNSIMSGMASGNLLQVGIGLAEMARGVADLATDFAEWGKKAFDAGKQVVEAHLASVVAKTKDIAAMVAHKVASVASTIATQAMAAAQWALNVAMEANPIVLAVVAIAALAAGLVVAYEKVGWFHDAVDKAWQIIQDTFTWIKDHWPLILGILTGPIGLAVVEIVKHWDKIKETFTGVKTWISDEVDKIVGVFTGMPARIAAAVSGMWDGIKTAFASVINAVIRGWNSFTSHIGIPEIDTHIPGVGKVGGWSLGGAAHIDPIELGAGGLVKATPGGTLALLGERGQDEFVIPRDKMSATRDIYITVQGNVWGADLQRIVSQAVVDASNEVGGLPIRIRAAS